MREQTRQRFQAYTDRVIGFNGASDIAKPFTIVPEVQQTLRDRMTESSELLSRINLMIVDEQEGSSLGLGVTGLIASRTDTSGSGERQPREVHGLTEDRYRCEKTDSDTRLSYQNLDAWAKFPDFELRIRNHILKAQALDRVRIGFNGTSVAATTNRTANPMGQDVNIGWLEKMRLNNAANVLASGAVGNKVRFGTDPTADFKTLDALVYSAAQELLDPWHRNGTDLVVFCSSDLLQDKYDRLMNQEREPTEQVALEIVMSSKQLGQMPTYRVPYFPNGKVLITSFDNLSIYEQAGTRRRHMIENPRKNGVENFESVNDAYVIEDLGKACLVENIEIDNVA